MPTKLKMILSATLLLGSASVAFADATEDYSNYPLANAYKYCNRGNAFACQDVQRITGQNNGFSAYGAANRNTATAPAHRTHRHAPNR